MKYFITIIFGLFTLLSAGQNKINTFHVVDSLSGKPVPSTSVTLIKARLSITTEKDGIFQIPGNLSLMRDTLVIYVQNYKQRRLTLRQLNGMDTIQLSRYNIKLNNAIAKFDVDTLLNDYKKNRIVHYAGVNTSTAKFEYLQMAQQFYTTKPGVSLKSIKLNRLSFGLDDSDNSWLGLVHLDVTRFRIRIYDIDPVTHRPGRDLCSKVIEESKRVGSQVSINLKKYHITIPNTTFFVAVEWMRDFYNAGYSVSYDDNGKTTREINYRPAIGISPVTGNALNIWALNLNQEWKLFTYFMPFGTDLAMSAVIAY
ncbi:hypothetical protein ACFS5N_02955 [Mucilaginibacter ximonensis]|uniref:Carboxypeptidase-like regulatory domain-containing protein n=1 Tax=Mucilaginibacter ximonensis TaxID=538021 RepID=A0ABW5Y963_9SPHI